MAVFYIVVEVRFFVNQNKKYEVFSLKLNSKDNVPVIICGICFVGKKEILIEHYNKVKEYEIGKSKDIFVIDYALSDIICKIATKDVLAVGASLKVDGVFERTGGIIGNPFEEVSSAEGDIETINEDIFVISSAGSPGIAICGSYFDAVKINNYLMESEFASQNSRISGVLKIAREVTDTFVLVSDGTGEGSVGRVIVSDFAGEYEKKL